ncbi:hypothetical protein ITJ66_15050 [Plantibacter sp. VKM Ac-2885]|uniref:hypothetical protein n=1 Tax=unclassified Plantibacter TaxID=2624265 RepID=UPI001889F315|nr:MULTISPECIES: hypothetical protein [unclassified Plantibacter]MBD8535767.1 hypothetical protein [Plantibacter sp. CFBP 13570]MBF4513804.1 hypothetical protein [Plantibacter sp. VKM Ac-2885]
MTQNVQEASTVGNMSPGGPSSALQQAHRWNASSRYGASLVAIILGAYLVMRAPLNVMWLQPASDTEVIGNFVLEFVVAGAVLLGGVSLAPVSVGRRLIAAAVVVACLAFHVVGSATASISTPPFLLFASFAVTLGGLAGAAAWLIVRGRSWPTLILLLAFAVLPTLAERLSYTGWSGVVREELLLIVSGLIGIGVAWAGAAIDRTRSV